MAADQNNDQEKAPRTSQSTSQFSAVVSLEILKQLTTKRLRELRLTDPKAKLTAAQLSLAHDFGFPHWRALKAGVERSQNANISLFFSACAKGDIPALHELLALDPNLVRVADPSAPHGGWTGLHTAARHGHAAVVRLLLQFGAEPNAREAGDNTYPLHWAAASRHAEIVTALLDAGGDVHGLGDDHQLDAIGWATFFHPPGGAPGDHPHVATLLIERGAHHHIFSALCLGDPLLIRTLVEQDPTALERRLSRFEEGLTPLHFALSRNRYDLLELLIELGAGLDGKDSNGLTVLESAMLRGDKQAMASLQAAGAEQPLRATTSNFRSDISQFAASVQRCVPMLYVPDVAAALLWYQSIGFDEIARYSADGLVNFGIVAFGKAEIMLNMHGKSGVQSASLWLDTDRVDELYQLLKSRQIESALAGETTTSQGIEFVEHLNDTFYGARQFGIKDLNGYTLYFIHNKVNT